MAGITKEEFSKIYKEKIEPNVADLEKERDFIQQKIEKPFLKVFIIAIVVSILCVAFLPQEIKWIGFVLFTVTWLLCLIKSIITDRFRDKLKKTLISKVLALYGDIEFGSKKNAIRLSEIKKMGLFRQARRQKNDDNIIGTNNGLKFQIFETELYHKVGSGDNSNSVIDFKGVIIKTQMRKKFSGQTVAGMKGDVSKPNRKFEMVEFESIDFMKPREVYSTDQIEARYIFTTSFIERMQELAKRFNTERYGQMATTGNALLDGLLSSAINTNINSGINSAFIDGYAYIFVPTFENFFDIWTDTSLYDENKYYYIFDQLDALMDIIKYLHLDDKTGL